MSDLLIFKEGTINFFYKSLILLHGESIIPNSWLFDNLIQKLPENECKSSKIEFKQKYKFLATMLHIDFFVES